MPLRPTELRTHVERVVVQRVVRRHPDRDVLHTGVTGAVCVAGAGEPHDVVTVVDEPGHRRQRAGAVALDRDGREQEASHLISPPP